jgi:hypothetical protein
MLVVRKGSWRACWFLLPALLAGVRPVSQERARKRQATLTAGEKEGVDRKDGGGVPVGGV